MTLMNWIKTSGLTLLFVLTCGTSHPAAARAEVGSENPQASSQEDILAQVNGENVTSEDLELVLAEMHSGMQDTQRSAFDLDRLLFRLVNDALLAQEARALNMHLEEPITGRLTRFQEKQMVGLLVRGEITSKISVSDEEIYRAFEQDYRSVTLHMATFNENVEAEEFLADVEKGGDFEGLAKERSIDAYRNRGGFAEGLRYSSLSPAIAEVIFALHPGQMAGPLMTVAGWAVVRADSFQDADPADFDAIRGRLQSVLAMRQREDLANELATELRMQHVVWVDEPLLAAITPGLDANGRLVPTIPDPDATVATVGDRTISAATYESALIKQWKNVRNSEAALVAKPIVLDRMIAKELDAAEAIARQYDQTPEIRREVSAYERRLLVAEYLKEVVASKVRVSGEEIETYYEAHRDEFRRPPLLNVGQITVETEEEAHRIAELLRQGTDFAWLARRHSIDDFAEVGGNLGWVPATLGKEPFRGELRTAQVGEVLGPKDFVEGFVVARVEALEDQGHYELREVSGNIRSRVKNRKYLEELDRIITILRENSEIETYPDRMQQLAITTNQGEGPSGSMHGQNPGHGD